jgi:RNA polymerase sigma-B factor
VTLANVLPTTDHAATDHAAGGPGHADGASGQDSRGRGHLVDALLRRRAALPPADPDRSRLRAEVVEAALPVAVSVARRYANRGEPLADIQQVAVVGLLKAVDGFDPAYPTDFWAYAMPTITGEIKRYFRDNCWAVHVPRRYKDLEQEVNGCRDELIQRLRRLPGVTDYAEHLGRERSEITQALAARNGHSWTSASGTPRYHERPQAVEQVGEAELGYEQVDLHESIYPALACLSHRDRRIITMRFFGNMTQSQIAADVGVSQMHVSRMLARILRRLRRALTE